MEDRQRYLYSCRDCSIRQRCIDSKQLSPGVKMTLARAFDSRTDTLEMWDLLYQDCLLEREAQQARAAAGQVEPILLKRLRLAQQPPAEAEEEIAAPAPKAEPIAPPITTQAPAIPQAVPPVVEPTPPPGQVVAPVKAEHCGLYIKSTRRYVRLPEQGMIVLGRSEARLGNPPDVDLTHDQGNVLSVSRHHARLRSEDDAHWLEDVGSTNGTFVNDHRLTMGEKVKLAPGDRILIGKCELEYIPLPPWAIEPDLRIPHLSLLCITHIGQRIELPKKEEIYIGRPDPTLGYMPDVDVSEAGDITRHVSRRHARLTTRGGLHFIQDVGSIAGTRLNGASLPPHGTPVLVRPGDQIWLGGCVIAYEWKLTGRTIK